MAVDLADIHADHLAAILYRAEDDIDTLLAEFAMDLRRAGRRIGGIVQLNIKGDGGCRTGMRLTDLMTGSEIDISLPAGDAGSCKLDTGGLAEAAVAVQRAIADRSELVIVNKFSKQEAAGQGLRAELADAIAAGLPVLTAVPEKCLDAWKEFSGGIGIMLPCRRQAIEQWWQALSRQRAGAAVA
ncbi:MAG: DUF2478 domain-containing protein [Bradyrhizobium sp.]